MKVTFDATNASSPRHNPRRELFSELSVFVSGGYSKDPPPCNMFSPGRSFSSGKFPPPHFAPGALAGAFGSFCKALRVSIPDLQG